MITVHCTMRPLAILAAGICFAACGGDPAADEPTQSAANQDTRRVINVEVMTLQARDFHDAIRLTGSVTADREVTVAAEEGGTVAEVLVDKGIAVLEGQALLSLDDDLLRAQRDEARAQSRLAQELWDRVGGLYQEEGIGTESGSLEARYAAEGAAARLVLIEERLQRTTIRAPFAGVFDTRLVEVGSVIAPGQPIGVVVDLEPLKVTAGVPERYAAAVMVGTVAGIGFSELGQEGLATVSYVGARVHPDNRTFVVELSLETPVAGAKPQMVADVVLQRRVLSAAVVVPRQALVRTESGYATYTVEGEGADAIAAANPVTLGPSAADEVVIDSGLAPGDRLIVVGQHQVTDRDRVRIVNER